jgi:hypothetical protein
MRHPAAPFEEAHRDTAARAATQEDTMTAMYESADKPPRPTVNAGPLRAGGAATAIVAALIAIVGLLVGRGLFGVEVLAPKGSGVWGDADTGWYALGAATCSVAATGLIQLLLLYTPKPMRFFSR